MDDINKRLELIDFDLEEIDDKEFEIPSVDSLPTLESILNENDVASHSSDIEFDPTLSSTIIDLMDSVESSSIGSFDSKGFTRISPSKNRHKQNITHGSILKYIQLKGITSKMNDSDSVTHGKCMCMTISHTFIAIGTSHSYVLVFDLQQNLKWVLSNGDDYGSVSSLSIRNDGSRLLCGYVRGYITLWNLQNGLLIKVYDDLHAPQTAVLHLKFLSDPTIAVLGDSSGSVFMLNFKKKNIESQCIFSGSRGEVLAIEPLLLPLTKKDDVLQYNSICLLAMATVTKVVVLSLFPSITVHLTQLLKGDADTLPLLCWQFVTIQISQDSRVIDPVIAFARQNTIYFYQATLKSNLKVLFSPLMQMKLKYNILNIAWLNPRTIATIDNLEQLHLIDVRSEEELEVYDIEKVQLVYGNAHFKGLATGGHVSPAMAIAGERACYNSVCIHNATLSNSATAQLLILGLNSVNLFTIRKWDERIELLLKENNFQDALTIALSFYEGRAKAVVGLSGEKSERQKVIGNKIMEILNLFVNTGLTKLCPEKGKIEILIEYYKKIIPVCVEYSLAINNEELLFGRLYERFSTDAIAKSIFIECLETYILDGSLVKLNPSVTKEIVAHYSNRKNFEALEAIVVRLDIMSLDIHQIMTLCWKQSLYDAIIYIHNQAFEDYVTPLEELLNNLQTAIAKGKQLNDNEIKLGNKIFVYITCSLTGMAYPRKGTIPNEKKAEVRKEILSCITKFKVNTESSQSNDVIYPYLRLLLNFDTTEFLNVLAIAFDDLDFDEDNNLIEQRQRIIDILLRIMVENAGFSPSQIGSLFIFLARQISKPKNSILINKMLILQIIEYLTNPNDESRIEERQQSLLELVQTEGAIQIEHNKLLQLAKNAKFFRICEYIHLKNKEWGKIMTCYLDDSHRKTQVFAYITQIISNSTISSQEKSRFITEMFRTIDRLTEVNQSKTANLLLEYTHDDKEIEIILTSIEDKPKILFRLLYGIFSTAKGHRKDASIGSISKFETAKDQRKQMIMNNGTVQEKYINLMCKFEPNSVSYYLKQFEGYRNEIVLEMCRKYDIKNAMAYLLEKMDHYQEAFKILFGTLSSLFSQLVLSFDSEDISELRINEIMYKVENQMILLIEFCQRCSNKLSESKEREMLWFSLLESIITAQQSIKADKSPSLLRDKYLSQLKELTNRLLNGMVGNIDLLVLLQKILQDSFYCGDNSKLSDIRELLMAMLETYNYQETLLQTTNNLIESDLHQQLQHLTKDANRSHSSRSTICLICMQQLLQDDNVIIFKCGHTFHANCLNEKSLKCHICDVSTISKSDMNNTLTRRISQHSNDQTDDGNDKKKVKFIRHLSRLNDRQLHALEALWRSQKVESRALLLNQLSGARTKFTGDFNNGDDIYHLNLDPKWKFSRQ